MEGASEEWSVSSNDAVTLSLIQPPGGPPAHKFHPEFTYPIFGEAEQIFGYKDLQIDLKFAAHDMRPSLQISYGKKFKTVGDTKATDLNESLREFLPPIAFEQGLEQSLQNDLDLPSWKPPGERVSEYSRNGEAYEIWAASLSDPRMKTLVGNIQILITMFIEGGTHLDLDDVEWTLNRWKVYVAYQKAAPGVNPKASPYSFVGYSTTYRFWRLLKQKSLDNGADFLEPFPPTKAVSAQELPSRLRISQFLILPEYQRAGHGAALYYAIYDEALADPTVTELTVEDPSEEFDKLRDVCDFKRLRPEFEKHDIKLNTEPFIQAARGSIRTVPTTKLLPVEKLSDVRRQYKIAPRQFARLTELYLLANIAYSHRSSGGGSKTALKIKGPRAANPDDRAYYWWRVLLKQRIYKKNKDVLLQLDEDERRSKMDDTANGQEDEYEGLLLLYSTGLQKEEARNGNGAGPSGPFGARKRRVIDDDDDEDGESDGSHPKRVKA
jgi:histone acetyltransferase 1